MSFLDWSIVAIPLIAIVIIGVVAQHYTNNVAGFLAAGNVHDIALLQRRDKSRVVLQDLERAQCPRQRHSRHRRLHQRSFGRYDM